VLQLEHERVLPVKTDCVYLLRRQNPKSKIMISYSETYAYLVPQDTEKSVQQERSESFEVAEYSWFTSCARTQLLITLLGANCETRLLASSHRDAREGKWRGNWRMQWVASTLHTTSEHGVSSITTADAHTAAASSRLNWRPPADLNGRIRSAERRNVVSGRVPSHFKRSLPIMFCCMCGCLFVRMEQLGFHWTDFNEI